MQLFTVIDDAHGIAKYPKGVEKQVKLYRRGERVYLPHSGGFIEVRYKEPSGAHNTSHPDVKLVEFSASGLGYERHLGQERMVVLPELRKAA
jgi:hypothetical protein